MLTREEQMWTIRATPVLQKNDAFNPHANSPLAANVPVAHPNVVHATALRSNTVLHPSPAVHPGPAVHPDPAVHSSPAPDRNTGRHPDPAPHGDLGRNPIPAPDPNTGRHPDPASHGDLGRNPIPAPDPDTGHHPDPVKPPPPPPLSVVIESLDFFTKSGSHNAFRLDLEEVSEVIVNPTIYSGLSSIPNGLAFPKPLKSSVKSSVGPIPPVHVPSPALSPQPVLGSYTRTLIASPAGKATSSFQFFVADAPFRYLIYNPSTGLFIGHTPLSTASSGNKTTTGASVDAEHAPEGTPIQAANLKEYMKDLDSWMAKNRKLIKPSDVVTKVREELAFWTWEIIRADQSPVEGKPATVFSYKIKFVLNDNQ